MGWVWYPDLPDEGAYQKELTMPKLIPAVAYLRRSNKKQDRSHEEQRREIEKLAASRGYQILRWLTESKSGDDEDRPVFRELMKTLESPECDFSAILVYDQGRFTRSDKEAAAVYFLHLRNNDVRLESVLEGVIVDPETDEDDFAASFRRDIVQFAKNKELKDLAARISRGKIELARKGIIGGPANYATVKREDGRLERGPQEQVDVLVWMFEAVDAGKSRTELCLDLNRRGVPSPTGKKWCVGTISKILTSPIYWDIKRFGRTHSGNHYHIMGQDLVKLRKRERGKLNLDAGGGIEPDIPAYVGDPIIPADLAQRVQQRIAEAKKPGVHRDPRSLPLVGVLTCGLCGRRMQSERTARPEAGL